MDEAVLWLPALADAMLRRHFARQILARGLALCRDEAVGAMRCSQRGAQHKLSAKVQGGQRYTVSLVLNPGSELRGDCSCPYAADGEPCKHQAALALAWRRRLGGEAMKPTPPPRLAPADEELRRILSDQPAEQLVERLLAIAQSQPGGLAALHRWRDSEAPIASAAAARRRVALLFQALPPEPRAQALQSLPSLLQAWRAQDPTWSQAGAEAALPLLCAQLDRLQAEGAWADGEADWQALARQVAAELLASWSAQPAAAPAYAPTYLELLAADAHGLLDPAQALNALGQALAERAAQLLCREWEQGAPAQAYLEHLAACGDIAERLRVLERERRDAAGHATYIAALCETGRDREALAAAEAAQRAHPEDGALTAQLIVLYERDGWDAEALALRRAQLRRDPDRLAYLELLARAPDAEAERDRLDAELGQTVGGQLLRLRLWAEQGRWPLGLEWLLSPAAAGLPAAAWADWLRQLPDRELAEVLPSLQHRVAELLARSRSPQADEQALLQALLARMAPEPARLWLAWLRVEWRRRPALLALLPA